MALHERWFTDETKFPVQFDTWSSPNSLVPVAVALGITIIATAIFALRHGSGSPPRHDNLQKVRAHKVGGEWQRLTHPPGLYPAARGPLPAISLSAEASGPIVLAF
jgi:hypothetical protein